MQLTILSILCALLIHLRQNTSYLFYLTPTITRFQRCSDTHSHRNLGLRFRHCATSKYNDDRFNLEQAILLASYAFDAYNEIRSINGDKRDVINGLDNTNIHYNQMGNRIERLFDGFVKVYIKGAKITSNNQQHLSERILSGSEADPFIQLASYDSTTFSARNIDSAQTEVKYNNNNPEYNQSFLLYISNVHRSFIEFRCLDHERMRKHHLIGSSVLSVQEIIEQASTMKDQTEPEYANNEKLIAHVEDLLLPLYADTFAEEKAVETASGWNNLFSPLLSFANRRKILKKRKRVGTIAVDISVVRFATSDVSVSHVLELKSVLPRGGMPGIVDWSRLLLPILTRENRGAESSRLLESIASGKLQKLFSIENARADSQGTVYADLCKRVLIYAFRGTETNKLQDILTDINIWQTPFPHLRTHPRKALVHAGFLASYQSIQAALLQHLALIFERARVETTTDDMPWEIYVTGHSLGGAVATLFAFDLMRIAAERDVARNDTDDAVISAERDETHYISAESCQRFYFFDETFARPRDDNFDPAQLYFYGEKDSASVALQSLRSCNLRVYTYGAPKVGDREFQQRFNSFVRHCFRVVNDEDIIARVPRTIDSAVLQILPSYEHVGKTVLIAERENSSLLVEGEEGAECPLRDSHIRVTTNPSFDLNMIFNKSSSIFNFTDSRWQSLSNDNLRFDLSLENLQSFLKFHSTESGEDSTEHRSSSLSFNLTDITDNLKSSWNALERMKQSDDRENDLEGASLLDRELALLNSILSLSALLHHLEPSYFEALNSTYKQISSGV